LGLVDVVVVAVAVAVAACRAETLMVWTGLLRSLEAARCCSWIEVREKEEEDVRDRGRREEDVRDRKRREERRRGFAMMVKRCEDMTYCKGTQSV
jgi:hypothetical protein